MTFKNGKSGIGHPKQYRALINISIAVQQLWGGRAGCHLVRDRPEIHRNSRFLSFAGNANFSRLAHSHPRSTLRLAGFPFDNISGAFVT